MTVAALKGLLDVKMGEPVNYVNAQLIAKDRGIKVAETKFGETGDYTNLITVTLKTDKQEYVVSGTIFAKDDARIVDIQGYRVDAVPAGIMIVTRHKDRPGVIGRVGTILGKLNINISAMTVGRDAVRGDAVMILTVDDEVPPATLKQMASEAGLYDARYVKL